VKDLQRIPEIDLLRFSAACMVVVFHFFSLPPGALLVQRFAAFGFVGVHLFFLVSGFVILMTAERRTAVGFVNSRLARLYPTFWTCVLITSTVRFLCGEPPPLAVIAANMTMFPAAFHQYYLDSVYWTLGVEMKFYGLVMFLLLIRQMARVEVWLLLWLAAATAGLFHLAGSGRYELHVLQQLTIYPYGPLFISGCYFYLIRKHGASWRLLAPLAGSCSLAIIYACTPSNTLWLVEGGYQDRWAYLRSPSALLVVGGFIFFAHLVFLALSLRAWRLPDSRAWYWLGGLTYPLYLLHEQAGIHIWLQLQVSPWIGIAIVVAAILLLSRLLAVYTEQRACRAMQRGLDSITGRILDGLRAKIRAHAAESKGTL
jgi:peptidoglycan/LPS O-acetylase OafA/YrhL